MSSATTVRKIMLRCDRSLFEVFYNPKHIPGWSAQNILADNCHPLYIPTARKYAERDRDSLWWYILCSVGVSSKRVVRSWCMRRARTAFTEALALRGYDKDGKPLKVREGGELKTLKGTLTFSLKKIMVESKYPDVVDKCLTVVDALRAEMNRSQEQPMHTLERGRGAQEDVRNRPNR